MRNHGLHHDGKRYCNWRCSHLAGDRSICFTVPCGCTEYSKKRRALRPQREQMRAMQDSIEEPGLDYELEYAMVEETGNTHFWLGHVNEFDEDSDTQDPEASLKDEVGERCAFVDAAAMILDAKHAQISLECARKRRWTCDKACQTSPSMQPKQPAEPLTPPGPNVRQLLCRPQPASVTC